MRQLRLRLSWRRRAAAAVRSLALPAAMLLALIVTVSVPIPTRAAQLGSGWSVRVVGRSAAGRVAPIATIAPRDLATARIAFGGTLAAAARRTTVTLVLQKTSGGEAATVGTLMLRADRVFGTQPASLPAIFSEMGVTPRPATTYRIAVDSGGATLASTAVALTR